MQRRHRPNSHPHPARQRKLYLIDLDNTLHAASPHIFEIINQTMTQSIRDQLGITHEQANTLRIRYWQQHGATIKGLAKYHRINIAKFVQDSHPMAQIMPRIQPTKYARASWHKLSGHKRVFTNAPYHYALPICKTLGIPLKGGSKPIIALEHMHWQGQWHVKPSRKMLLRVLCHFQTLRHHTILIDDSLDNLRYAKQLGIQTIWIVGYLPKAVQHRQKPLYVDRKIKYFHHAHCNSLINR